MCELIQSSAVGGFEYLQEQYDYQSETVCTIIKRCTVFQTYLDDPE